MGSDSSRGHRWARVVLASVIGALVLPWVGAIPAQASPLARVNFQPASAAPPTGYLIDSGSGYTDSRAYGWVAPNSSSPVDLTSNARDRGTPADRRLATLMHMQRKDGATGKLYSGRWEYALASGTYDVTVAVGDGGKNADGSYCCLDSVHRLTVEGVLAINNFTPTPASPFFTTTVTVAVSDGRLTIDPAGGVNTKINYVDISASTGTPTPPSPQITGVTPAPGASQVSLNTAVTLDVNAPIDAESVSSSTFTVSGPAGLVDGQYNTDAAGGTASFTPSSNLAPNATYSVSVNGLRSTDGETFAPFSSTFTTGTAPPPLSPYAFSRVGTTPIGKPGVMTLGPDGRLYVATANGTILRYTRNADGTLGASESASPFGSRIILGLAFDPLDSTKLWVVNNHGAYENAPRFSGRVSTLTIQSGQSLTSAAASATDVIIGLPRSAYDHMTNGIAFGPDRRLYIAQGANTAYGDVDDYWGPRGESPLSAAVLVADVHNTTAFPSGAVINVNTDPVGTTEDVGSAPAAGYDPTRSGAPVSVYAPGVRNAFSLTWASNGKLYAPVNESAAGGNAPAGPGGSPPAVRNIRAYPDYFTRIDAGKYYGHPNPSIGYYRLNGGNPTSAGDPAEVLEYPVGVAPDANWRNPDLMLGLHRSADGSTQFMSSSAFGGAMRGDVLLTEYSSGDDVLAVQLDSDGKAVSTAAIPDSGQPGQALIFNNPLGIVSDPVSGTVYVSEYGDETDATAGAIVALAPGTTSVPPVTGTIRVNFQPGTASVPSGYTADTGAAWNGTQGWQDLAGTALDLTANTRDRNSTASPDQRYDTLIHMQAPAGSGTTTPGQWARAVPDGAYDVTVAVGDPTATNSVHTITAEAGTADSVVVVPSFRPTTGNYFLTATKRVTVSDGVLTLSPDGGTNTKLDFVTITPATSSDTVAPVVTVTPSGSLVSGTTYSGDVKVSITASDNVGVSSLVYTVDGGPTTVYTGPITVSGQGDHVVAATGKDAAGNTGTDSATFTIDTTPPPAPTSLHVNFQSQTAPVPAGYTNDYGLPFDAVRGSGWEDVSSGSPLSLVGNGRDRNSTASADQRYDTFMHMQLASTQYGGVATPGRWESSLANGTYDVTVAVGDATATNSVHRITAEPGTTNQVVLIDNFVPSSSTLWSTVTARVTVSDGRLTLTPAGGTNTKIDFVDAVPAGSVADTTKPQVSVGLAGTSTGTSSYAGDVTVSVSASDEPGGSGIASVRYSLDGGPSTAYSTPFVVTAAGSHTVVATATDVAGNSASTSRSWSQTTSSGTASLKVTTPDDSVLTLGSPTLVFSTINGAATPSRPVTFTNNGSGTLTVTGVSIGGTNSGSFRLASGQPTSFSIGSGQSATVNILFTPTAPTNCPTSTNETIGDVERYGTLQFTSNDANTPTGSVRLGGINACNYEGSNEPVLSQIVHALGYTTKVSNTTADLRYLGPTRILAASDEIQVPYWVAADSSKPVSLTPVAMWEGRNTASSGFGRTGWYAKGAAAPTPCSTSQGCQQLFIFPPDEPAPGEYVENQKLMPGFTGTTTFSPTGAFGLWNGDFSSINYTDDGKNYAINASGATISPPHYLHDLRVYPAYGPNRVRIANTWIIGADITRTPSYKNNDYQDVVFVLHNARPELGSGPQPGTTALNRDLTAGGTVGSNCSVTGFDGVMPNTAGTQCNASNISFGQAGLSLTSTSGQMGGSNNNQQNALFSTFDASRSPFAVTARVKGPINYLTSNYQQVAAFFGPDQDNYVKVEAEHNGAGTDPHLTMFFEEKGVGSTVATVSVPGLTTASTLDLIIKGFTSVPDPTPAGSDPNSVRNYPLGQVAVYYSLNGGAPVQVGTVRAPTDVTRWFSTSARAGLLVSGGGSTTPFTATFTSFAISTGTTTVGS
jgi:hypothetical protein